MRQPLARVIDSAAHLGSVTDELNSGTDPVALAHRVAADPAELPRALAQLLEADFVSDRIRLDAHVRLSAGASSTTLRIPTPWTAPVLLSRPGRPFSPAECVRAHRLADIARTYALAG
jgi:hypothetical protein